MLGDIHENDTQHDPPDVGFGSRGPAIDPLLRFLDQWAKARGYANTGIVVNQCFGIVALRWLQMLQAELGLRVTSAFDSATRARAKELTGELRFDYAAEANENGFDITVFVQPGGLPDLYWASGFEADQDRAIVEAQISSFHLTHLA